MCYIIAVGATIPKISTVGTLKNWKLTSFEGMKEYSTHQDERWVFLIMLINQSEFVKTVSADNAENFDRELNKVLNDFAKKGIRYTVELAPSLGFTAFIRYKRTDSIPETLADEFELGGEVHHCIECPYYVRPTDGRVKLTRCNLTPGVHRATSRCCDEFYEKLFNGEIELVEVIDWKEEARKGKNMTDSR